MNKPTKKTKKAQGKKEDTTENIFLTDSEKKMMADAFTCARVEFESEELRTVENAKGVDIKNIANFLSEYMSNYILIGYDLNGNCYEIANPKSRQEADCLIEALRRTANKIVNNGGFNVPEDGEE